MDAATLDLLKIFVPSAVALIGVVFAWKASVKAKESVDVTNDLGLKLDGRLEELKKLWQSEANLQGRLDERLASEAQQIAARAEAETKRVTERAEARTDKQDEALLLKVDPNTPVPVETRTEAKAADSEANKKP